MNLQSTQVGFRHRVRLEWLERAVAVVFASNDRAAIVAPLQGLLRDKVSVGGPAERGNREKILSIIMKTWSNPPRELDGLRVKGLELMRRLPRTHHIVVHWGWSWLCTRLGRLWQTSLAVSQVFKGQPQQPTSSAA